MRARNKLLTTKRLPIPSGLRRWNANGRPWRRDGRRPVADRGRADTGWRTLLETSSPGQRMELNGWDQADLAEHSAPAVARRSRGPRAVGPHRQDLLVIHRAKQMPAPAAPPASRRRCCSASSSPMPSSSPTVAARRPSCCSTRSPHTSTPSVGRPCSPASKAVARCGSPLPKRRCSTAIGLATRYHVEAGSCRRRTWTFVTFSLYCTAHEAPSSGVIGLDPIARGPGPRLDPFLALQFTRGAHLPRRTAPFRRGRSSYWNIQCPSTPRALAAPSRRACGEKLFAGDADPGPGHPDRSERPRPARHRPDRHRQDCGVHAAVARPSGTRAQHPERRAHSGCSFSPRPASSPRRSPTSAETYARFMRLSVGVIFGGIPQLEERAHRCARPRRARRHPGPPARPDRSARDQPSRLEILVLDEADQMLDLGFIHALKWIVSLVPPSARPCSSRPPCRRRSRNLPTAISPTRPKSR